MTLNQVNVHQLKEDHPRQYQREYDHWLANYATWDGWHNYTLDRLIDRAKNIGIHMERRDIRWSGFYSQGDGLAFDAEAHAHEILEHMGKKDQYLALWHALQDYGSMVRVVAHRNNYFRHADLSDFTPGNTPPAGIFKDLPVDAWDELVGEQFDAVALELESHMLAVCKDLASDAFKELCDEYDYQTSEDSFIEACEVNSVMFDVEGEDE